MADIPPRSQEDPSAFEYDLAEADVSHHGASIFDLMCTPIPIFAPEDSSHSDDNVAPFPIESPSVFTPPSSRPFHQSPPEITSIALSHEDPHYVPHYGSTTDGTLSTAFVKQANGFHMHIGNTNLTDATSAMHSAPRTMLSNPARYRSRAKSTAKESSSRSRRRGASALKQVQNSNPSTDGMGVDTDAQHRSESYCTGDAGESTAKRTSKVGVSSPVRKTQQRKSRATRTLSPRSPSKLTALGGDKNSNASVHVGVTTSGEASASMSVSLNDDMLDSQDRGLHNSHTRKCRQKVNSKFQELLSILPAPPPKTGVKHKAQILDYTIRVFREISAKKLKLEAELALSSRVHLNTWVDSVIGKATQLADVLGPFMSLVCTKEKWPYAEAWVPAVSTIQAYEQHTSSLSSPITSSETESQAVHTPRTGSNTNHVVQSRTQASNILDSRRNVNKNSVNDDVVMHEESKYKPGRGPQVTHSRQPAIAINGDSRASITMPPTPIGPLRLGPTVIPAVGNSDDPDLHIKLERFRDRSRTFVCKPRVDLPGRIMCTMRPEWLPSLVDEEAFQRALLAKDASLSVCFGVPVFVRGHVAAIAVFFDSERRPYDAKCVELADNLAGLLGNAFGARSSETYNS